MLFDKIKNDILGKKYNLSIAYVSKDKSRELNRKYRKKDKPTNVLSFSLYENMGELVLCKDVIKKESEYLDKTFKEWNTFLVIHGMLHLKGYVHGGTMEEQEEFFCRKYDKKYFNRHRRGVHDDTNRSGRVLKRRKIS